jgi:UDP-N-acetylglucosamine 2-epimerase (non-hydrolysing)
MLMTPVRPCGVFPSGIKRGNIAARKPGILSPASLVAGSRLVLTDSGGLQEETTALGVPCLTLREQTERPITVACGTNRIVGTSPDRIVTEAMRVLIEKRPAVSRPPLWDGPAAERIVAIIREASGRSAAAAG